MSRHPKVGHRFVGVGAPEIPDLELLCPWLASFSGLVHHPLHCWVCNAVLPHARSTHAMVSVAHLMQDRLTPVRHPRVAQAHCTSASSCSCPKPAQDWQGSRAVHLSLAMQWLSGQGCRADHLLSVRPWIAGHRPNHLLVCLSLWHDVLLHRVSQFTHVILYLQSARHACLLVWSVQCVDMVHTLVASCAQHFASLVTPLMGGTCGR